MSLLDKWTYRKLLGLIFIGLLLANVFWFAINTEPVFGQPYLTLKWTRGLGTNGKTDIGALAADLDNDGDMEIVVTGAADGSGSSGAVRALNGDTGAVLWTWSGYGITQHTPVEIADLDQDGFLEIVVPKINSPMALRWDGSVYWEVDVPCGNLYSAVYDVNGDGYPEVFVNRHKGMENSYDYDTMLSYDGTVLRQAWAWHSCWGGFAIGDANFDGRYELYQGDRSSDYNPEDENYKTGGNGIRAFDALTLTPLWNNPDILCSSTCPILADVDKDGILDVITFWQTGEGPVVLNSTDGSVLTTGGITRKGASGMRSHSQGTVYDIDGDGNLEMIVADNSPAYIWDLYDWKLDAVLPIDCYEPPKVGDVTGDGVLDIIATTVDGNHLYVYDGSSYDEIAGTYDEVDHVTGLHGAMAFSLVQDVDGDGDNELVVTSLSGEVYCYDTDAPAPFPRVRSTTPFYSEYRRGAAEFVPLPSDSVVRPALSDEEPANGALNQALSPTLSVNVSDFQGHLMDIVFRSNVSGTWEDIVEGAYPGVGNDVYSASPAGMGSYGATYYWGVNATDLVTLKWSYNVYSFTTLSQSPTQSDPLLESSLGTNGTKEDLTCYNQTTFDPDSDEVTNIYNWIVDGDSLTNLLLPFDTRTDSGTRTLLDEGFESDFDNWSSSLGWDLDPSESHSGSHSARADGTATYLTSNDLDTSTADGITVSFWYRHWEIEDNDHVYLEFYDGSNFHPYPSLYVPIFEIGTDSQEGEWHQYSMWYRTLFQFQIPNFRIRFDAEELDSGDFCWIDDVLITIGGAPAKDYSDYGNDGAVHGATWTGKGVVGGAYNFSGTDYIRITENGNSLGGDGSWSEISVEFWVKATADTGTETLMMKHDRYNYSTGGRGAEPYGIGYWIDFHARSTSNEVSWYTATPSQNALTYTIPSGARDWHHIVCTYKSGPGLKLYVDGVEVASLLASGDIAETEDGPLNIGHEGSGFFIGMLDEVRIYPRALTPFQVSMRYNETKDGLSKNSTIEWHETEVGEDWRCEVTPNDSFGDGTLLSSNTLTVESSPNVLPVAENLTITPSPPISTDDLVASYDYSDDDGDPEYGTEIRWYNNTVLEPSLNDLLVVPSSFTARGQVWYFTVRPNDGVGFGELNTSDPVTILNSPPTFTDLTIAPSPPFEGDTLTATPYGWFDPDNDTEGYDYHWEKLAGTWENLPGEIGPTLDPANFVTGDYIRVNVTANDGFDHGTSLLATTWIVDSDPPEHGLPLLVSSHGTDYADEELIGYNQSTWDPDGDEVTNIYNWIVDGDSITRLLMPFEINSTTVARDHSDYLNDGAVQGATWTSEGVVGGAYIFDGNDYIRVAENTNSLGGDGSWSAVSVEFWVKATGTTSTESVVFKHDMNFSTSRQDPYGVGYRVDFRARSNQDQFYWYVYNDTGVEDVRFNDYENFGEWHHVVCTYESGVGLKLYVEGIERDSIEFSGSINATLDGILDIGGYGSGGTDFSGILDEVRIYPKALSSAQVFQRYFETKDGFSNSSTIVPQETTAGEEWEVEVIPSDSWQFGTAMTSLPLTVQTGNDRPRIDTFTPSDTTPEVLEGESLNFNHTSSDPDGDTLSYSWLLDDVEQDTTQNWTYSPDFGDVGTHNVTLVVSDGLLYDSQEWTVTVTSSTQYGLVIEVSGSGTTNPAPGTHQYYEGAEVPVDAIPDLGWTLHHWLLNDTDDGSDDPYTVIMDDNYNLTAVFVELPEYNLTIGVVGNGMTDPEPGNHTYYEGSEASVDAIPDSGWKLNYWLLDDVNVGDGAPYIVTMDTDHNLTAVFVEIPQYSLIIEVVGSGNTNPAPGTHTYDEGTVVYVTAIPDPDWRLEYWLRNSSAAGSDNPYTITMDDNYNLTAVFVEIPYYGLVVEVRGSGTTDPDPGTYSYYEGAEVPVDALPFEGWALNHWLLNGSDAGSADPYPIIMDDNYNLTAVFVEVPYLFADGFESGNTDNWSGTSGSPTVVGSPVHHGNYALQCDSSGEVVYRTGFSGYSTIYTRFYVRINALPATGQSVKIAKATNTGLMAIWELYLMRSSAGTLQIRLKSSVPSTFDQTFAYDYAADTWYCFEVKYYQSATGEYRVWLDGVEILSRTGVDTSGREFGRLELGIQWSNYAVTTYHDCVAISETYIGQEGETPPIQYQLTTEVSGSGTTDPVPGTHPYPEGTVVYVDAIPDPGWALSHWLRNSSAAGSDNPYTITMDDNYNLTAVFVEIPEYGLVIEVRGSGITDPVPGTYSYPEGSEVPVTAFPVEGWVLSHWLRNGSDVGSDNPYTVTMDQNRNLTAVFIEFPYHGLVIEVSGSGTTDPVPDTYSYPEGSEIPVNAIADPGWTLDHWLLNGTGVGSDNPYTVTMDQNRNLTAVFVEVPYLFADGFESGNTASWSGTSGSPTVVGSPVHHGAYALQCDASGEVVYRTGFSGYSTIYTRFYVQIHTLPANGQSVKVAKTTNIGSLAIWELYFQRSSGGTLLIRLKSSVPSTLDQTFAYSYAVDTWYCFEVKYSQHASAGEYRVWLDGVEILSRTGVDTSGREFGRLELGIQWSNYAVTTYHDCVVISETYIGQEPGIDSYTLNISVVGSGSTVPPTGEHEYASGDTATVTAIPDFGWDLDHWLLDGGDVGSTNPIEVLMNDNYTLTAVFVEVPYYGLVVEVSGSGATDPPPDTYAYPEGSVVSVTAIPDPGWGLDRWLLNSSDVGADNPYILTMDDNYNLTAVFVELPEYNLTIGVVGNGMTDPEPGNHTYYEGSEASVDAIPDSGWKLNYWLLDDVNVGDDASYMVTMDTDHNLTAVFVEVPYLFEDGFESGDLSAWSGYALSPSVVTSPVHDGSYALQCDSSGEVVYRTGFSGYSTVYVRFYVQINALPASGQSVKIAKATDTGLMAIWELYLMRSSAGTLQIRLKSSVPDVANHYFAYDYAVGTWYCFEVKYSQHASAGEYMVWLDGVEILSRTGVDTSGREFGRLELGVQWSNYAVTTYHDCVAIDQTYIGQEP